MKFIKNKARRVIKATNAIDSATTTSKRWGFIPVPNKFGATTNFEIPKDMFERELKEMKEGIINA